MSVLPILPQGFVVGRILTSRGDSSDADKQADTAVVVGMVDFTPATAYRKLDAFTAVTHSKITAKLDSHGDLHPQREASDNTGSDAEDGIWLPVGTWAVAYRLNTGFGALPGHNIEVTEAHTEAAPLPLFANMGDAPQPGASYVTMQVPLNGQPGHYLVLNGEGSGLAWASGVLPETISDAVEDYLVANPPAPAPDATTTVKGLVELATTAEAATGTDTTRAVTPEGLKAVADTKAATSHTHGVTDLTATGTRDATTYLRGDNTWATPAGGGGGVTDHGALSGLADDDHAQYALADGTRGAFAAPLGADDNYVTDAEKVKLANLSGTNTGDQDLSGYATTASLATVATTGAYADLSGRPTIPDSPDDIGAAPASGQATVNALTAAASVTVPATHSMHTLTMTGNTTLAFSNPTAGHAFTLKLSGAFTPTFPASVTWAGGSAPAYASGKVYVFATFDAGTSWIGSAL